MPRRASQYKLGERRREYYDNTKKYTSEEVDSYWTKNDPYDKNKLRILERFCEELIASGYEPTRAAINMGISKSYVENFVKRYISHPEFEKTLDYLHNRYLSRLRVRSERVIAELAKVAFSSVYDYIEFNEDGSFRFKDPKTLSRDDFCAISELSQTKKGEKTDIKIKLHDKMVALDRLGKYFGLFSDRPTGVIAEEVAHLDEEAAVARIFEIATKLQEKISSRRKGEEKDTGNN